MEKTMLKPMLIATIAHMATRYAANWNSAKEQVQKVVDFYTATGLPAMNSKELHDLFNDTENMLYVKLTGGKDAHLSIGKGEDRGHLPINQKAAMELINKPAGYNELLEGIKECSRVCIFGFEPYSAMVVKVNTSTLKEHFLIDESGNLDFTDKVKGDIAEAGKVYAKTPKGQAIYAFIEKVKDAFFDSGLYEYRKASSISGERIGEVITESIASIDIPTKTFTPILNRSTNAFPTLPFDSNNPTNQNL